MGLERLLLRLPVMSVCLSQQGGAQIEEPCGIGDPGKTKRQDGFLGLGASEGLLGWAQQWGEFLWSLGVAHPLALGVLDLSGVSVTRGCPRNSRQTLAPSLFPAFFSSLPPYRHLPCFLLFPFLSAPFFFFLPPLLFLQQLPGYFPSR